MDARPLAKLNRPVTLWDIGWALFWYREMKVQTGIPNEPTASERTELGPETLALVDAFSGVTADEAINAFHALGFGFCRARNHLSPCLRDEMDTCCPEWAPTPEEKAANLIRYHRGKIEDACKAMPPLRPS